MSDPCFRRVVRANRLIAEGKCPGCEVDYKPKIAALERRARIAEMALSRAVDNPTDFLRVAEYIVQRGIDSEKGKQSNG